MRDVENKDSMLVARCRNTKTARLAVFVFKALCWRLATLPKMSTIATTKLNFCVRNGNRCTLRVESPTQNLDDNTTLPREQAG